MGQANAAIPAKQTRAAVASAVNLLLLSSILVGVDILRTVESPIALAGVRIDVLSTSIDYLDESDPSRAALAQSHVEFNLALRLKSLCGKSGDTLRRRLSETDASRAERTRLCQRFPGLVSQYLRDPDAEFTP